MATEIIETVTECVAVLAENPKPWNPADGWKELNFPVVPEEGAFVNIKSTKVSNEQLDLSQVNITRGTITGRAACRKCKRSKWLYLFKF